MNKAENVSIVVFGHLYVTLLDMVRALGKDGFAVYPVCMTPRELDYSILNKSRYAVKTCRINPKKDKDVLGALIQFIKTIPEPVFLFPTDDRTTEIVDENMDELKKHCMLPIHPEIKSGYLTMLMNKGFQGSLARKAGMNVPEELIIDLSSEEVDLKDVQYPCFCKPAVSAEGWKREQKRCDNQKELSEHLEILRRENNRRSVIIQPYLNITEEYIVLGLCTLDAVHIIGVVEKLIQTKYTPGLVNVGILEPISQYPFLFSIKNEIESFLKETKYIGLFDLEFTRVHETLFFNELNIRPSGLGYCMVQAGVNAPSFFVRSALGDEKQQDDLLQNVRYGRTFIKEKNAFKDYYERGIGFTDLLRCFLKAKDKLMYDPKDKGPALIFYKHHCWRTFKRLLYEQYRRLRKVVKNGV